MFVCSSRCRVRKEADIDWDGLELAGLEQNFREQVLRVWIEVVIRYDCLDANFDSFIWLQIERIDLNLSLSHKQLDLHVLHALLNLDFDDTLVIQAIRDTQPVVRCVESTSLGLTVHNLGEFAHHHFIRGSINLGDSVELKHRVANIE